MKTSNSPNYPDLSFIQQGLPQRSSQSYKYQIGYLLALVGSHAFPGAAVLSCQAAARIGAGGVKAVIPHSIWPILASHFTEIMMIDAPETERGTLSISSFPVIQSEAQKCKALLVGCGIGRHPETQTLLHQILTTLKLPMILDADALWGLTEFGEGFVQKHAQGNWILTPHDGEFARLLGQEALLPEERENLLKIKAQEWNCVILLKGIPGLIACPDGTLYTNPTGNPAATTAGCGDVLAGICAGLLAQGLTPVQAAITGLYIAGLAADKYREIYGGHSLLASDLIHQLPLILGDVYGR